VPPVAGLCIGVPACLPLHPPAAGAAAAVAAHGRRGVFIRPPIVIALSAIGRAARGKRMHARRIRSAAAAAAAVCIWDRRIAGVPAVTAAAPATQSVASNSGAGTHPRRAPGGRPAGLLVGLKELAKSKTSHCMHSPFPTARQALALHKLGAAHAGSNTHSYAYTGHGLSPFVDIREW